MNCLRVLGTILTWCKDSNFRWKTTWVFGGFFSKNSLKLPLCFVASQTSCQTDLKMLNQRSVKSMQSRITYGLGDFTVTRLGQCLSTSDKYLINQQVKYNLWKYGRPILFQKWICWWLNGTLFDLLAAWASSNGTASDAASFLLVSFHLIILRTSCSGGYLKRPTLFSTNRIQTDHNIHKLFLGFCKKDAGKIFIFYSSAGSLVFYAHVLFSFRCKCKEIVAQLCMK